MRAAIDRLRPGHVAVVLVLAHLALTIYLFVRVAHAPFNGDETAYVQGAEALSNVLRDLLSAHSPNLGEVARNVVSNGWFMPGTSILLAPLFLFAQPDVAAVRAYMGVVNELLLLAAVVAAWRWVGRPYALALLVFPALVPMWIVFSFTTWGDPAAGPVIVVLISWLVRLAVGLRRGHPPTWRDGAVLGVLCVVTLYLRSSALPLVAGVFALVLIGLVVFLSGRQRRRAMAALGVAVAVFAVLLAPWSLATSKVMRAPVVTTTTVPLSMAVTFGDPNRLCFGPCGPGNVWFNAVRYSREVARMTGSSELDVQKAMSDYALSGLTARKYATDVVADMDRYLFYPSSFEVRFHPPQEESSSTWAATRAITDAAYFAFLAVMAAAMLLVVRASFASQVVSVLLKLFMGALLAQPFVHVSSGRYWPVFAPLLGLAAALIVVVVRDRGRPPEAAASAARGTAALTWVQAGLAAAFALVVLGLLVVGVA